MDKAKNKKLLDAILNSTPNYDGLLSRLDKKDKQLCLQGYDMQNEFRRGFILAEDIVKKWAQDVFPLEKIEIRRDYKLIDKLK